MAISLATNLLYFHPNKLFKNTTVLATFQKNGRFFSKSSGHPVEVNCCEVFPSVRIPYYNIFQTATLDFIEELKQEVYSYPLPGVNVINFVSLSQLPGRVSFSVQQWTA
jgi:hypothetical protein